MNCPEDSTPLDLVNKEDGTIEHDCSLCGGHLVYEPYKGSLHPAMSSWATLPAPEETSGEYLRCPKDGEMFLKFKDNLQCQACHGVWIAGAKTTSETNLRKSMTSMATQVVGLLVIGIGLFSWQNGSFSSSASTITSVTQAPTRALMLAVWFFTFMLLFSVPASIYMQMVQAHRPHFKKAITHPIVMWAPIMVVLLMAANIYFLTP